MANPKHFDILTQGTHIWNKWRKENRDVEPDLSDIVFTNERLWFIDLHKANLRGANLSETSFLKSDLSEANLSNATLYKTNLTDANLHNTNLSEANLQRAELNLATVNGANFFKADFSRATLENIYLTDTKNMRTANLNNVYMNHANLDKLNLQGVNLSGASLTNTSWLGANLSGANLSYTDLRGAKFSGESISELDLRELDYADREEINLDHALLNKTDFSNAKLNGVIFNRVKLIQAKLIRADLSEAILRSADLSGADLSEAILNNASLVNTNLKGATLKDCSIYGISAWDVNLENATQSGLVITNGDNKKARITVDDLEVAQFIYLLINNSNVSKAIDTITSKVVLILGNFQPERLKILHELKEELHKKHNLLPVVFDFTPPNNKDLTQTVSILANLSRFVIVDFTQPRSAPFEFSDIVFNLRNVPVKLMIEAKYRAKHGLPALLKEKKDYPGLLGGVLEYKDEEIPKLLNILTEVVESANKKTKELIINRAKEMEVRQI